MQGLEQRADPTDAAIIGASMTEPQAFRELFARHVDPLFTYFARRLGRDAADDLTAEVFLTAFDRRARYDLARTDARRWLYGIAANLLRRHRRAEVRRLRDRAHALRRVSASGPLSGGKAAISRDRSWQSLPDGPGPVLVVGDHGMRPGELAAHALAGAAQAGADGGQGRPSHQGPPLRVRRP